jgi:glycosyltransferase involved in cell wall biosynthesis
MPAVVSVFGVKPFRIGGTETFARELSLQLQQRGLQSVLCFLSEPTEDVRRFLSLPNVAIEILPESTGLNWNAITSLARIIRKHRPQILHLHFTGFLGAYPWLARLLSVRKIFFTDHTSRPVGYVPERAPWWKRAIARTINRPITKVVCVSRYGERCLTTLDLLPTHRHQLVYNAVDLSRVVNDPLRAAEFRKRYEIPKERVVIVQVSWMIPEKGIPELLETARLLVARNRDVHFVLVGEGPHREQFMKTAEASGLGDHISWTGLVEDPFGEGIYDVADIICQLSEWEELFGWMIAEAMAYGKPIVATRVGGIPELVDDGVSGFLVDRGDTVSAAEKLDRLAKDPELRRKMGQVGKQVVSEKFDLQRNVAQLLHLYGV